MQLSRIQPGVFLSAAGHAALLAWAVVSIAAPRPLEVPQVDAMPVDIVPIEELTRSVKGSLDAPVTEAPATTPTKAPPRPEPAENTGDTARDIEADAPDPTPEPTPKPPPEPEPLPESVPEPPKPQTRPEPKPESEPEPKPALPEKATQTEPAPAEPAEQKTDIAALAKQAEAETKAQADEEDLQLPQQVAAPKPRPKAPKPAKPQKPAPKQTKTALLDKSDPSAGGAKRSEKPASRGVSKANSTAKLSASEIDALRGQIQKCWNVGALSGADDAAKLRAKVVFRLNRDGTIDGRPTATASGSDATTNRTFAGGARRAVQRCAPYKLPAEKYETWADVTVNFSLADML